MDCLFCKKEMLSKNNNPSYYDFVAFCMKCPYVYYEYDENIFFKTKSYEFNFHGINKIKLFEPTTIIIKTNNKIIYNDKYDGVNKEYIKNYFSKCKDELDIDDKIYTMTIFK